MQRLYRYVEASRSEYPNTRWLVIVEDKINKEYTIHDNISAHDLIIQNVDVTFDHSISLSMHIEREATSGLR